MGRLGVLQDRGISEPGASQGIKTQARRRTCLSTGVSKPDGTTLRIWVLPMVYPASPTVSHKQDGSNAEPH